MKKVLIVIGIAIALGLTAFLIVSLTSDNEESVSIEPVSVSTNTDVEEQDGTQTTEQSTADTFTTEQVAEHDSSSDCWTIINGDVYDITSYVSEHPGGSEITRACGIDGTTLFESRETESGQSVGSGTPHSSSAQSQLQQFKIGTLSS